MSSAAATSPALVKQHVIDPEICIRCGTCEATCTQGAVSHDDVNYVVAADKCNFCMDCIAPCPTGSIDNWRVVKAPYSLEEQLGWAELPAQEDFGEASSAVIEAIEIDVGSLLEKAHAGLIRRHSVDPVDGLLTCSRNVTKGFRHVRRGGAVPILRWRSSRRVPYQSRVDQCQ
jgi:ferredoxin